MNKKNLLKKNQIRSLLQSGYSSIVKKNKKKVLSKKKSLKEKSLNIKFEKKKNSINSMKSKLNLTPDCIRNPNELFCENVDGWEDTNKIEKYPKSMLQSYLNNRKSHLRTKNPINNLSVSRDSLEKSRRKIKQEEEPSVEKTKPRQLKKKSKRKKGYDREKDKLRISQAKTEINESSFVPKVKYDQELERKMNLSMEANPSYFNIEQVRKGNLISPITYHEDISHLKFDEQDISGFKKSSKELKKLIKKKSLKNEKNGYLSHIVKKKIFKEEMRNNSLDEVREKKPEFKKNKSKKVKKSERRRDNELMAKFIEKKKSIWKSKDSVAFPPNKSTDTLKLENVKKEPEQKKTPRLKSSSLKKKKSFQGMEEDIFNPADDCRKTLEFNLKIDESILKSSNVKVSHNGTIYEEILNSEKKKLKLREHHLKKSLESINHDENSLDITHLFGDLNNTRTCIPTRKVSSKNSSIQVNSREIYRPQNEKNTVSFLNHNIHCFSKKTSQSSTTPNPSPITVKAEKYLINSRDIELSEAKNREYSINSNLGSRKNSSTILTKSVVRKTFDLPLMFNGSRKSIVEISDPVRIDGKNSGRKVLKENINYNNQDVMSFNAGPSPNKSISPLNSTRKNLFKNEILSSNQITLNHTNIKEEYLSSVKKNNFYSKENSMGSPSYESKQIKRKLCLVSSIRNSRVGNTSHSPFMRKEVLSMKSSGQKNIEEEERQVKFNEQENQSQNNSLDIRKKVFSEAKQPNKTVNYNTFKSSRTNHHQAPIEQGSKYLENNPLISNVNQYLPLNYDEIQVKQKFNNIMNEIKNGLKPTTNGKVDLLENTSVHFSDFKDYEDEENPAKLKKIIRDLEIENREKDVDIIKLSMQVKDLTSLVNSILRGKKTHSNIQKSVLRKKLTRSHFWPLQYDK